MDLALSPGISTERPFLMVKKSMPIFQLMKIRSAPSCVNISITPKKTHAAHTKAPHHLMELITSISSVWAFYALIDLFPHLV